MTEKYKIYLSEETRLRLINDAELFEFTKKDESVNLNAFLKTLIVNYFDRYRRDSEALLDNIMKDLTGLTSISNKAASALADKIISTYIKADNSQSGKNSALTLTVSGASKICSTHIFRSRETKERQLFLKIHMKTSTKHLKLTKYSRSHQLIRNANMLLPLNHI